MTMSVYEKIETVVLCRCSGTYGRFTRLEDGHYRVEADGLTVIVKTVAAGWSVKFKASECIDEDLITAARYAIEDGRTYSVSRDYRC